MRKYIKYYVVISIVVIISIMLPYYIAYINTPENMYFVGFVLDSMDNATYISKMQNAEVGFTFINKYTLGETQGGYHFLFYLLLGKIALFFNIQYIWMYHISRIICSFFFLIALYLFLKQINIKEEAKILIFALVSLGGTNEFIISLGNLLVYNETFRGVLDAGMFVFPSMLYTPHFIFVMTLQLFAWRTCLNLNENLLRVCIKIGLILLIISFVHPFNAVFTGLTIGLYLLFYLLKNRSLNIKNYLSICLIGIIPLPYLSYSLYAFNVFPMLETWQEQAITRLAPLPTLISYIGLPLLLSIFVLLDKKIWKSDFNVIIWWYLATLSTIFIPVYFQGRLWGGIGIPMFILIGYLLSKYLDKKKILYSLLFIFILNTIWLCFEPIIYTTYNPHRYIYNKQVKSYKWISDNLPTKSIILSDEENGNYIPMFTKRNVALGHMHETKDYKKMQNIWGELSSNPNIDLLREIKQMGVNYIYGDIRYIDKEIVEGVEKVYDKDGIRIYKIII